MVAVGDDITAAFANKLLQGVAVNATITIAIGTNANTATVAFGVTFTSAPALLLVSVNTGTWNVGAQAYSATTTGCTVRVFRTPGDNAGTAEAVPITLVAIGAY